MRNDFLPPTVNAKQPLVMHKTALILFLILSSNIVLSQTDSLQQLETKRLENGEIILESNDSIALALQGCICDPIIANEIGISFLASNRNPNFGLKLDYKPILRKRIYTELEFRTDLLETYKLDYSIETLNWLRNKSGRFDLSLNYKHYNIDNFDLSYYNSYVLGVIYRIPWLAFKASIGKDNYVNGLGYNIGLSYKFHKQKVNSSRFYQSKASVDFDFGYWDKEYNYKFDFNYWVRHNVSLGLGHEKLYNFSEFKFHIRYLILK